MSRLKNKQTLPAKLAAEREANERCARIILEQPDRYAGIQVEWARMVLANRPVAESKQMAGRLF